VKFHKILQKLVFTETESGMVDIIRRIEVIKSIIKRIRGVSQLSANQIIRYKYC